MAIVTRRIILSVFIRILVISTTGFLSVAQQPSPSLSMTLFHSGADSIVIGLLMTNLGTTWKCDGVQATVSYNPNKIIPNSYAGSLPIHDVYFASHKWWNFSNPFVENDGFDPDLMGYGEMSVSTGSVTILANTQFYLCKMNFQPLPGSNGYTSFSFVGNTGADGITGYLKANISDLQAFSSVQGLTNVWFPVELRFLTARVDDHRAILHWVTESETNNAGFEIQRRYSNRTSPFTTWRTIDFVRGKGTTSKQTEYIFIDNSGLVAGKYQYRLKQIDFNGQITFSDVVDVVLMETKTQFALYQNYPNPTSRHIPTIISWSIGERTTHLDTRTNPNFNVHLGLFNIQGKNIMELINGTYGPGFYSVEFVPTGLEPGLYFYVLRTESFSATRAMIICE